MPDHHHHHHHHHWRNRHDYAYSAGEPGPGPNRHRLYKDRHNGMVAGVCAGIAKYYGWNANGVRIALVFLSFCAFFFAVVFLSFSIKYNYINVLLFLIEFGTAFAKRWADGINHADR